MFWLRTLVGLKRSESAAASRKAGVAWAMVGNYDRLWFEGKSSARFGICLVRARGRSLMARDIFGSNWDGGSFSG